MVAKKSKGLGRGLDALLGGDGPALGVLDKPRAARKTARPAQAAPASEAPPATLPIGQLEAGKYQPRTRMDEGALQELADSIRAQGIMQPILVRPIATGKGAPRYEIIAGERRFRAARLAGLAEVPVLVREVPDEHAAVMALIENIQREDLNPLEEAHGVQRLLDEFGLTHEQAAQAIGRSRSATSNLLRLLNLAQPVQTMLLAGDIDMGHARALLAVDAAMQIQLANVVVAKRLSVRETEKLVAAAQKEQGSKPRKAGTPSGDVARLEEALSDLLGTKVSFKIGAKERGQIVIDFHGWDHLSSLLERQGLGAVLENN
ncbi:ParB/RepB/Spo0J family partition protein [Verticiella sediminum]|uniref:ParB/RepB/Spo0J family partition protein n=1 Tax=Verticiella sediminum TaxID=1247510 RepID=A0A556B033_9BURK|nr:ParB/RepB/Spo0J family partition protein [Verticiella sediminum]TSH98541.1 ParB/RepB/Spo0J family partition protein [Verticiella sediminum]